jgi:hypothetical protein
MFRCERCSFETQYIGNIRAHLKRTYKCEDTNSCQKACDELLKQFVKSIDSKYVCEYCKKKFANKQSKYRHKKTCIATNSLLVKVHDLQLENDMLRKRYEPTEIEVVNFGEEDFTYIIDDKEFLKTCLKMPDSAVTRITERMFYDEDHKDNKTILLKSLRNGTVVVHVDKKWVERTFGDVLPSLINKIYVILHDYFVHEFPKEGLEAEVLQRKKSRITDLYTEKRTRERRIAEKAIIGVISSHKYTLSS